MKNEKALPSLWHHPPLKTRFHHRSSRVVAHYINRQSCVHRFCLSFANYHSNYHLILLLFFHFETIPLTCRSRKHLLKSVKIEVKDAELTLNGCTNALNTFLALILGHNWVWILEWQDDGDSIYVYSVLYSNSLITFLII